MMQIAVNYYAVIAAAVANMVVGFLWYGPLFGKQWVALMGWSNEQIEAGKEKMKTGAMKVYPIAFVGSLLMAYVLQHFLVFGGVYLGISGISLALVIGFWSWLGFVAPVTLSSVLWEGRSWKLWILGNAHYIVAIMVMGTILALWM